MPRRKILTDAAIAKLPPRPKPYTVPDLELPGHYPRVRPTGAKTFVAVARDPNGEWKSRMLVHRAEPLIHPMKSLQPS